MHYNRSISLGHIKEKIEEGIHRIQRIEWLPCDLHRKALFIQTSVWPFALYSCDTTYIGQKHFDKLRRATVNTLVGHWHNASPMLACNFLSKFLMDPFLYTLCQCIRIIRRLATVQHDLAVETVQNAATYDGSRPFGPATSFRHYLNQVGWELNANGIVSGPDHLQFDVLKDPIKKIINTCREMWNHHIIASMDRKGIGDFLLDSRLSLRVFAKCTESVQQLTKMNVVGGFQTQSMKAIWDKETSEKCVFCGECDTRDHRLLHCPLGTEIRSQYPDVIEVLHNMRPEWIYMPLPRQHEMAILIRAYTKVVKPPIIPAPVQVEEGTMMFYTDGGALNPTCTSARLASWAVVQDVAGNDDCRRDAASFLYGPSPKFPCFRVLALGIVHGDQTVARGELIAILTAAKIASRYNPPRPAVFITDASYVCNIVRLICSDFWRMILRKIPNCDLVVELAEIWNPELFQVKKVKSHRRFESATDFNDLCMIAGNYCADLAATAAFRIVPHDIRSTADVVAKHVKDEEQRLMRMLEYLAAFNKHRCDSMNANPDKNNIMTTALQVPRCPPRPSGSLFPSDLMGADAAEFMRNFYPDSYRPLHFAAYDDQSFSLCLQGANIAKAVRLWLEVLTWPPNLDEADSSDWGILWFELAISFYLYTGYRFPLKVSGAGNKTRYVDYNSNEAIILPGHQRSAVLQSICLRNMIQNLTTVLDQTVFPPFAIFKYRALTRLGHKGYIAGIPRRPGLPNARHVSDFVVQYLSKLQGIALCEPIFQKDLQPELHFEQLVEPPTSERYNKYAAYMKTVRKKRNVDELQDDN